MRVDAIARLGEWRAPDAEQERLRRAYLAHLERYRDALSRSGPPRHLTGSVLVLDPAGERVLLTLHQKARRWFQFGGHFEPGDLTMRHGAEREAREESGIDGLSVHPEIVMLDRHALGKAFGRCREHLDVRYMAVAPEGAAHAVSHESLDVRWWPADSLPEETREELVPLVRAAQRVIRR
jgi:8-oxo-dGTP pyrophosphatase MutT (NUDIX family)